MKTFVILVIIMAGLGYIFLHTNRNTAQKTNNTTTTQSTSPTTEPSVNPTTPITSSIFVPYWTVDTDLAQSEYDRLIYFGVTANKEGIDTTEPGYAALDTFVGNAGPKEKYLTLRLLNSDFNQDLLSDSALQKKVIDETSSLAGEKGFDGIVLDLELSNIPLEDLSGEVSAFIGKLYSVAQKDDLRLSVAIYGDTFYRKRPFDLSYIGKHSDEVMVMAYDFSKSYGEPGPNFPLSGTDEYGYDFREMLSDFSQAVPAEKLTVIFGMYGYDWTLGHGINILKLILNNLCLYLFYYL